MTKPGMHIRRVRTKLGKKRRLINPAKPRVSDRTAVATMWKIINKTATEIDESHEFHINKSEYFMHYKRWSNLSNIPTYRQRIAHAENHSYYQLIPKWKRPLSGYVLIKKGFKKILPIGVTFLLMRKIPPKVSL